MDHQRPRATTGKAKSKKNHSKSEGSPADPDMTSTPGRARSSTQATRPELPTQTSSPSIKLDREQLKKERAKQVFENKQDLASQLADMGYTHEEMADILDLPPSARNKTKETSTLVDKSIPQPDKKVLKDKYKKDRQKKMKTSKDGSSPRGKSKSKGSKPGKVKWQKEEI